MKLFLRKITCLFLFYCCILTLSFAHRPGQSYIYFVVKDNSITGNYQMNVKDINAHLGTSLTNESTLSDYQPYLADLQAYALEKSSFEVEGVSCKVRFVEPDLVETGAGTFLILYFELENVTTTPDAITVKFDFFYEYEASHSNWLMIESNWKGGIFNNERIPSLIFDSSRGKQVLDFTQFTVMRGFLLMVYQGMKHIWIGFDHILFLLALLLPSVIARRREDTLTPFSEKIGSNSPLLLLAPQLPQWGPLEKFRPAFLNVVKVVTFFTIAHSITLSIAALELIQLPGRAVESIIALSIAIAAFHAIRPVFTQREWLIVFGFGLFHGFGFASVLGDLGVTGEYMLLTLLGFNLGVEIGQIVIIILIFPFLFWLRNTKLYPYMLTLGSIALVGVALYWFAGRAFDFEVYGEDITEWLYRHIERFFINAFS